MKLASIFDPILLASAIALGGYLLLTSNDPTTTELTVRSENVLPAFDPSQIVRLRWEVPEEFILTHDASSEDTHRYFLGSSKERVAEEASVRGLLRLLDLATWKRRLGDAAGLSPKKLGFDDPRLVLHVEAGPRSFRLVFGGDAPAPREAVYLKIEGTNVETTIGAVDRSLFQELPKSEQEFLGGLAFPQPRSATRSILLESNGKATRLVAQKDGFFLQDKAKTILADREFVDLIFFQLARTKLESYLERAPAGKYPAQVTQETGTGERFVARVGLPCPSSPQTDIVLHRTEPEELIGCVPASVLAALLLTEERLTSRRVTSMNADEIDHVLVEVRNESLDLIREGAGYKLLSQGGRETPREAGDEFLSGLATTRLEPLAAPPKDATRIGSMHLRGQVRNTIESNSSDGTDHAHTAELDIFEGQGDELFIQRKVDGSWLAVPTANRWFFSAADDWARDRKISSLEPQDVSAVDITLPDGTGWKVHRNGELFYFKGEPSVPADPMLTRQVLSTLTDLDAVRFVSPARPRPSTGLLHVAFEVEEQSASSTRHLWLGARVRGGYLAWSDMASGTFVVSVDDYQTLQLPLVDRRDFRIKDAPPRALRLRIDGREFAFETQAGVLRAVGAEANDDMLEPLLTSLRSMEIISAAGNHPDARAIERGKPTLSIEVLDDETKPNSRVLHFGRPVVWQGQSAYSAWIEGESETYFVLATSLIPVLNQL